MSDNMNGGLPNPIVATTAIDDPLHVAQTRELEKRVQERGFSRAYVRENLQNRTWDELIGSGGGWFVAIGDNTDSTVQYGCGSIFYGPGVGTTLNVAIRKMIIMLPNNRLLVADLRAETAEFMEYSDDAACVAPEFRDPPA